ncbi:MAG: cupin domain-containing protein [Actinomycetota bacterium]|jgi:quercetin dioxygenase-like cupin family protein|nr:cupin domain-containing protein [Actinomycetota bacterium]
MRIISKSEKRQINQDRYNGEALVETLRSATSPKDPDVLHCHYDVGVVTNWHSHPGGQLIYVLSDEGVIGNEADGEVKVTQGELISVPPVERHYHGSTQEEESDFLVLTWGVTNWDDVSPRPRSLAG